MMRSICNALLRTASLCFVVAWWLCPDPVRAAAPDTLRLSLQEAEALFLQKNLLLLAQHYDVDMARADVIQSRLYNNPSVQFAGNIYNPQLKKPFDMSERTGQYTVEVQQLISLAGKRNKQVRLAESVLQQEESMFFDVLRTLRFSLRSTFFQLYFLQQNYAAYQQQLDQLHRLQHAYQDLFAKGRVSAKDAMRIKSLLYRLQAEQADYQNQVNDVNAALQLLIQQNGAYVVPAVDTADVRFDLAAHPYQVLLDTAYANRADLALARHTVTYAQRNYALQKAMAIPDLTAGFEFDKRGNFVDNATFFTLGMDLPLFGRNQGNIKAAQAMAAQADVRLEQQNKTVENEVLKAYAKVITSEQVLTSFDPAFRADFLQLLVAVTENFERHNISLLEFTDFYESYKDSMLQLNQLENDRMQAIEALQFSVGKNIQ